MRVYHLNCGTSRLFGTVFVNGSGGIFTRGLTVTHCLLIEASGELVLIDTGYGIKDYTEPAPSTRLLVGASGLSRNLKETAAHQVTRLGFDRNDVRHIVLTHLHPDHAGGLADLPYAQVHVFAPEYQAAMRPSTLRERAFYIAEHWAHDPRWVLHSLRGEQWFGFDCVRIADITSLELLLVPLPGHTRGHCGVAVRTGDKWLFHCGDAYKFHGEMNPHHPTRPLLAGFTQWLVQIDHAMPFHQPRLRALVRDHSDRIQLLNAHDPAELFKFQTA
jgi:glyoxylase-like metal-dependent hydrolase (beta-lactamase superfamily II)